MNITKEQIEDWIAEKSTVCIREYDIKMIHQCFQDLAHVSDPLVIEYEKALLDIQNMCIGQIAMGYNLDPYCIGEMITQVTGFTNPALTIRVNRYPTPPEHKS